jgi:5,6-dimethylbenzimidazole synthase
VAAGAAAGRLRAARAATRQKGNALPPDFALPAEQRRGVYAAIYRRRDIRHFRPDPVPPPVLARLLDAAHHAPSVGFMQPWDFILIADRGLRARVHALFLAERARAAETFPEPRRSRYLAYKLEGILDAPLNVCVTCDVARGGVVLGRRSVPETDVYSTCLAIQNFWLAARAEGLGVGWVSILCPDQLARLLALPPTVVPVAYLCVGYPEAFAERPLLETTGWRARLPLERLVHYERWGGAPTAEWAAVAAAVRTRALSEPAGAGDGAPSPA